MPMGVGLWYNPRTDKAFSLGYDTHERWIKNDENAVALGLSKSAMDVIATKSPKKVEDVDEIRLAAIMDGMVRIRDNGRGLIAAQFRVRRGKSDLLFRLHQLLASKFNAYDQVLLHNMATNESVQLSISEMGQKLRDDEPILFRESIEWQRYPRVRKLLREFKVIKEASYSRTMQILRGLIPTVETIGILTANNPHAKPASKQYNAEANERLEAKLREYGLGFRKALGKYGITYGSLPEDSFVVFNPKKQEILKLGRDFGQESVIIGEKTDDYDGMKFSLIYTDDRFGQVAGVRYVFITPQDAEDNYTELPVRRKKREPSKERPLVAQGKKFNIPLFDDGFLDAKFGPGSGVINKAGLTKEEIDKIQARSDMIMEEGRQMFSVWLNRHYLKNMLAEVYNEHIAEAADVFEN